MNYSRTIHYDAASNISVIFHFYGTVWPKVIPHCLATSVLTVLILFELHRGVDWTISEWGHEFMGFLVGFLVVNRCSISFNLYYEMRGSSASMVLACRELVSLACALTNDDYSNGARQWRKCLALDTMRTIRTVVAVLRGDKAWELPELDESDRARIGFVPREEFGINDDITFTSIRREDWVYSQDTGSGVNLRAPLRMASQLRSRIASQQSLQKKLDSIQNQQLYDRVSDFLQAYVNIGKYLTTPFPYPLINMNRTFLLLYVYSLPFALLSIGCQDLQSVILVFVATYGFVGIELVSMELENPFGDDPSDLEIEDEMKMTFDDICLLIFDLDGIETARELRLAMHTGKPSKNGRSSSSNASSPGKMPQASSDNHATSETTALLA